MSSIHDHKEKLKISIVSPTFYKGDAVGHAAHDCYKAIVQLDYKNVRGIGVKNDFQDMPFEYCDTEHYLSNNIWFKNSNLIIWHFSIYDELFNHLHHPQKTSKHVICFHNITPKQFMPKHSWHIIDKSIAQLQTFNNADAIWADSRENKEELIRHKINPMLITELPIAVDRPTLSRLLDKPKDRINILCIGRFYSSKGILDVIDAAIFLKSKFPNFLLRLIGNPDFSDPIYIRCILEKIKLHGMTEHIDFVGKVSEKALCYLYAQSHIYISASYHEGFCVPVIESLRAGMIPVTYDAANLRWIAGDNGLTVPTGDITALSEALFETCIGISQALAQPHSKCIRLNKCTTDLVTFDKISKSYAENFNFTQFCTRLEAAINALF